MPEVKIVKVREDAVVPSYGSDFAAGADLYACCDRDVEIKPHETVMIPTGIALEIPTGFAGLIYARSGIATKMGLAPANKVGVIDSDYRGEVLVALHNHSNEVRIVNKNDRIAQLVITPFLRAEFSEVQNLSETQRDSGGFGSTGK